MPSILDDIVAAKRVELVEQQALTPLESLQETAAKPAAAFEPVRGADRRRYPAHC